MYMLDYVALNHEYAGAGAAARNTYVKVYYAIRSLSHFSFFHFYYCCLWLAGWLDRWLDGRPAIVDVDG